MELGLFKSDVARKFNIRQDRIARWENNSCVPYIRYFPVIIEFLGYCPFEFDTSTMIGKIKEYRCVKGLTQAQLGKVLKVDASSVHQWEIGKMRPHKRMIEKMMQLFTKKPLD